MILRKTFFAIVVFVTVTEWGSHCGADFVKKSALGAFFSAEKIRNRRSADKLLNTKREDESNFKCSQFPKFQQFQEMLKTADDKFRETFVREVHLEGSSNTLQLAWTGKEREKILVVASTPNNVTLSLSTPDMKFENITSRLGKDFKQGAGVLYIVKHPHDREIVYLVGSEYDDFKGGALYVSMDSSLTFKRVPLNFSTLLSPGFIFHSNKSELIMAYDEMDKALHLSNDKGLTWKKIASNVISAKWSQSKDRCDDIFVVKNDAQQKSKISYFLGLLNQENVLERSEDFGKTWIELKKRVHSFGVEGSFVFVSIYLEQDNNRALEVSTDNGRFWNRVRLPVLTPDRFFSILDLSGDLIFLHVDESGDNGRGTLYTSDATGIIFSESLPDHLFPNFEDVTDFFSVQSMPGVFITNQLMDDDGIQTKITFNRGAEWQSISRPEGAPCEDESKPCFLQIHNQYSIKRGIKVNPPLSVPNAKGIILVHGHVADSLQSGTPDVYVSRDGGSTWHFALKGPHHYQIADHGGLLVAVPADTDTPNVIKFSANSGRCWVEYKFTKEEITFTGLLIEPGNTDGNVALWGYTDKTSIWHTFLFNFTKIIENKCDDGDYKKWSPRLHDGSNCILGRSETNFRVMDSSWCLTGKVNAREGTVTNCTCTREDYGCDYGYVKKNDLCVKSTEFEEEVSICLRQHKERLVPLGYHKIPGDTCVGGFTPPEAKLIPLDEYCKEDDVYSRKDAIKDYELAAKIKYKEQRRNRRLMLIVFVVLVVVIVTSMLVLAARKIRSKYRNVVFKYSSIKADDEDDNDDAGTKFSNKLAGTSLYDDESSDEENQTTAGTPNGTQVVSGIHRPGYIHPKLLDKVASNQNSHHGQTGKTPFDSDVELLE